MVTTTSFSPLHPTSSSTTSSTSTQSPLAKKMSITQTYFLAHKARAKLSREAAQPDHNLRLLVGHANLLDSLMLDLAEAEREQESWFNQSVRGANPKNNEERHIQWADSVPDRSEEDWEADSSDSESDSDDSDFDEEDEDVEMADVVSLKRMPSYTPATPQLPTIQVDEVLDDDDAEEDDEEDFAALTLTRSPSHSASPPELDLDSESSEDESMPPSPPFASIPTFSEKRRESTATETYDSKASEDDDKSDFYNDGYYLPPRNPNRLVSAISVY
ncbi:hypothetical protein PG993_013147 [Apiospora rasikravindrae]|uniref:Protein ECM13 n=1 Tax=Apiospora rasikravindrae TaxID=990691 RepID=A0ABR1RWT5_9PEZI